MNAVLDHFCAHGVCVYLAKHGITLHVQKTMVSLMTMNISPVHSVCKCHLRIADHICTVTYMIHLLHVVSMFQS